MVSTSSSVSIISAQFTDLSEDDSGVIVVAFSYLSSLHLWDSRD